MNVIILIVLTVLTLSIAFWLFLRKMNARMPFHVAKLVFEPEDLKDFSSFFTALTGKLTMAGVLGWMAAHGKELFQRLAEHDYGDLLADFCVDEATAKLVFDAVQSAGDTQVYGRLLKTTVTSPSILDHLEKGLPADPYLKATLKARLPPAGRNFNLLCPRYRTSVPRPTFPRATRIGVVRANGTEIVPPISNRTPRSSPGVHYFPLKPKSELGPFAWQWLRASRRARLWTESCGRNER